MAIAGMISVGGAGACAGIDDFKNVKPRWLAAVTADLNQRAKITNTRKIQNNPARLS